eukprot:scaffold25899_cov37-Cyclotella_meneghiniana.AAC.1
MGEPLSRLLDVIEISTLDPLSPNNQRPPGTRSGSQYNADANANANPDAIESNPNPPVEVPSSNQSTQSNKARSIDAPEEQQSTRSHASNRSSRSNRSRASNRNNNSQPVPSSASQKSNNSRASTANKSQRQPVCDPDGINADDLVAPPQPPGSRSRSLVGSSIAVKNSVKSSSNKENQSVVSDITPSVQNQGSPSTPYVDENGDVQNLPPGIVTNEVLSPLDPNFMQNISKYIESAVKERLESINENNKSISSSMDDSSSDETYSAATHRTNVSSFQHSARPLEDVYIVEAEIGGSRYTNVPFIIQVGSTLYYRYANDLVKPVKVREAIPPTESRKHPIYFVQYYNGHTETVTHDKLFVPMDRQYHRHENGVIDAICEVLSPQAQLDATVMHEKDPHSIKMYNSENLDYFKIDKLKTMLKDVKVTDDKLSTLNNVVSEISIATQAASTSGNFALPQVNDLSPTRSIKSIITPPSDYPHLDRANQFIRTIAAVINNHIIQPEFLKDAPIARRHLNSIKEGTMDGLD